MIERAVELGRKTVMRRNGRMGQIGQRENRREAQQRD